MTIELPKEKIKASRKNPKSMVIFGQPKTGKSTAISGLDDCLTIDLERGTEFLDILKYDVLLESEKQEKLPIIVLKQLINAIKEENKKRGVYVYKRIALDTVTALEDIVKPLAKKLYQNTPKQMGFI